MATLDKIRSKGVLLAVIVGTALLAFIIGDFLNSGSTLFHQARQNVAEIAGEKINISEFSAAIEQMTNVYKIETGQNDFTEEQNAQLRTSVWDNMVNERILASEAKKLGLSVSKDELTDRLIGKNIHPLIMQRRVFMDEKGQFSPANLLKFYNNIFGASNGDAEQLKEAKNYWLFWEKAVKNAILQEKYAALISKSVSSNTIEAKYNYDARKTSVDVNYVMQPYFAVSDSAIKVTDAEIKERYNKEKENFKQEANRSINYVAFDVVPLQEDFKEAEEWIKKVSEEFKTTTDVAAVVNSESDISYDGRLYSEKSVPASLKDFAFGNATGAIYGPVFQNNTYTMARVMESGIMQSDSVKLRHIFLAGNDEKKADSIIGALKSGSTFADMAMKYSAVKETAANGGEIGWITEGAVGKEITGPAFSKPLNEIFKVSSAQGIQIMQVTDKTPARRKVKLAILERKVTPSSQSYSKIYNGAKEFAANSTSLEKFEANAKQKGYVINPAIGLLKNSDRVNAVPQSRQVVRWAFENKKGTVSDVFDCGTQFIVATTTEINEEGYKTVAQASAQLKAEIIKDKKADLMIKNLSTLLAKYPTLETLAPALNTEVKTAPAVNFAGYQLGEAGFEPYVIGKASVLPTGKVSAPLKGNAGVYVILPGARVADNAPFNAKMESAQLDSRMAYSLPYTLMEKLKEKYKIVDNRSNFY